MSIDVLGSGPQFDEEPEGINGKARVEIDKILKRKGVEGDDLAPTFDEVVNRWRAKLFAPGAIVVGAIVQTPLMALAPAYYRVENGAYIAALSFSGAVVGIVFAEAVAYYLADRDTNNV